VSLQSLRQPPAGLASVCGLGHPKKLSRHRPCSTWNSPVTELEDGPARPLIRRRSSRPDLPGSVGLALARGYLRKDSPVSSAARRPGYGWMLLARRCGALGYAWGRVW